MAKKQYLCTSERGRRCYLHPTCKKVNYMKAWTLDIIIAHFDAFLMDVDFPHLPARESEEYRQLLLKTANDVMFSEGRYSRITEWTLEMFDVPEVCDMVNNLTEINRLTAAERMRLKFYLDVKEVCYPLFRGQQVDWTAWPWKLNDGRSCLENKELYTLITACEWPNISAAILYDLEHLMWMNEEGIYSSVACNEVSNAYEYTLASAWKHTKTDDDRKAMTAAICKCADDLWAIENHVLVGQLLGFDLLEQSVYDAFDTFIDTTYRHNQVLCAKALSAWIREHWTLNERHPAQEQVDALYDQWKAVMAEYEVTSPDESYSWNILTLDVLGMSMFSEEEEMDDDSWDN